MSTRRLASVFVLSTASIASAQCLPTWFGGGWTLGFDDQVSASTLWDPDGPGPLPEWLIVAGRFSTIGDVPAPGVAAWDGTTWRGIGDGIQGAVRKIIVVDGTLVIAGDITATGPSQARYIARLEGNAWRAIGPQLDAPVRDAAVLDGRICVGMNLGSGIATRWLVRRWNGTAWEKLGTDTPFFMFGLHVHKGHLCLVGATKFADVSRDDAIPVMRWGGSAWVPVASSTEPAGMTCLTTHNGDLFGGTAGPWWINAAYKLVQGRWQPIGQGLGAPFQQIQVSGFARFGSSLLAYGLITNSAGYGIARWTGSVWDNLPGAGSVPSAPEISTLQEYQGELIAGGWFTQAGASVANYLARWNGTQWRPTVEGTVTRAYPDVRAAVYLGDTLVVGGNFELDTPEGLAASVARYESGQWRPLGVGFPTSAGSTAGVNALTTFNGEFIAGGNLSSVFRWDGSKWSPTAYAGIVYALAEDGMRLVAGGLASYHLGNNQYADVVHYNGTAWQPLGNAPSDTVYALTRRDGKLIAGGAFLRVGTTPANYVAQWDGTAWSPIGAGPGFAVRALASHQGRLYAGGESIPNLAEWDGSAWRPLPGFGGSSFLPVYAIASDGPSLVVGGRFASIAGTLVNSIARWDGTQWSPLSTGLRPGASPLFFGTANAILPRGRDLIAVGRFSYAGDRPSPGVAFWGLGPQACYADCDCSGGASPLSVADFQCFLAAFAGGSVYANCDQSTIPPTHTVADFICFLNAFARGCTTP